MFLGMLSVVLPAYNEEKMLAKAAGTISSVLEEAAIPYELVFVNDGSRDGTWAEIEKAAAGNPHIAGDSFFEEFWKGSGNLCGAGKCVRGLLCRDGL